MKYFIFRNNTLEAFFPGTDYAFSGYDDISSIPEEASNYIWFYQVPFKSDVGKLVSEIDGYAGKLRFVHSQLSAEKTLLVFTLVDLFPLRVTTGSSLMARAISRYNETIYELADSYSNVKLIPFELFTAGYAIKDLVDWKYYFISQMSINPRLGVTFRKWFASQLNAIALKRKKCLVLDLDNTLWGGVVGEEGVEGIKIGGDYPGKAFLYFQEALVELSMLGIILAVCSKNNEADVLEVWEKNPFMALKQNYISAYRINWQNKADNIKELASELNIGLDSVVFVDDNPSERELVKQLLPMVEVPEFPSQPYGLMDFFQSLVKNYFQVYSITDEDMKKTRQYKANADRAKYQKSFTNFDDFLSSLDIQIDIELANEFTIPRIAQMTQKTNQFNLTTKRYSESDIRQQLMQGWKIWTISVSDKFGDNGITGCVIVNETTIDSLLLSCRILGKGIEFAFVAVVMNLLKESGINMLFAEYRPTPKNIQVTDFYEKCGFVLYSESDGTKYYHCKLNEYALMTSDIYKVNIK